MNHQKPCRVTQEGKTAGPVEEIQVAVGSHLVPVRYITYAFFQFFPALVQPAFITGFVILPQPHIRTGTDRLFAVALPLRSAFGDTAIKGKGLPVHPRNVAGNTIAVVAVL